MKALSYAAKHFCPIRKQNTYLPKELKKSVGNLSWIRSNSSRFPGQAHEGHGQEPAAANTHLHPAASLMHTQH